MGINTRLVASIFSLIIQPIAHFMLQSIFSRLCGGGQPPCMFMKGFGNGTNWRHIEYSMEVIPMLSAAVWLIFSSMLYPLRLSSGGSFPKPLTAEEERHYLALSAQGDLEARNILIERNLRLVAHIMKKYYAQTADQEDLISIGTIGLIKGISTFDASKGTRLATYAARCVENEILMYFRSQRKTASDVSLSEYIETGKDGNALSLIEVICSDEDLFDDLSAREMHEKLHRAMAQHLSSREQTILALRYGLGGRPPMTQREIAAQCGISRSYVSRIEKKALQKLESALEEYQQP